MRPILSRILVTPKVLTPVNLCHAVCMQNYYHLNNVNDKIGTLRKSVQSEGLGGRYEKKSLNINGWKSEISLVKYVHK